MKLRRYTFVLAIFLTTRGFAFTLFEGPQAPVDWGVSEKRGLFKNDRCLKSATEILERYRPDYLVLQDTTCNGTRRTHRIAELNALILERAEALSIPVATYSRADIRAFFAENGIPTKEGIADAIAKHIPFFERYVPPTRKPWMSEDARMGLFDAAALALTFFGKYRHEG